MRLVVALAERGYLEWFDDSSAVLRSVARQITHDSHVLVRTGTLIDRKGYLQRQWTDADSDDDRSVVATAWRSGGVGALYFEGLPDALRAQLELDLGAVPGLIGFVDVTREPLSALVLQDTLPLRWRIVGRAIRSLYTFDQMDGDAAEVENDRQWLEDLNAFDDASLEDLGVRGTIFDPNTTDLDRALRGNEVVELASNAGHAETAILWLDVTDFRLTDALHAAVDICAAARSSEQAAQGALSVRRFLEQLADALFPPRGQKYNGRSVRTQDWKNRLWAALDQALGPHRSSELQRLGQLLDDLKDRADVGVHRNPPIAPAEATALVDELLGWIWEIARVLPPPSSAPVGPYESHVRETLRVLFDET